MSVFLIIPGAGSGRRLGLDKPKAFVEIGGKALILHTLNPFFAFEDLAEAVIAVPPGMERAMSDLVKGHPFSKKIQVVLGGTERQDSVMNAFQALEADASDIILIHDAARPLVSGKTIGDVIEKARAFGAAAAVVPVTDTLKSYGPDGAALKTVDRNGLFHAQTPQGFRYGILKKALDTARREGIRGTDTASLVEHLGLPVKAAAGEGRNIKITTRDDLAVAEILLT
jgi:2-C-methyl-D-erythritol 4-phosphate cytidylyltransferase